MPMRLFFLFLIGYSFISISTKAQETEVAKKKEKRIEFEGYIQKRISISTSNMYSSELYSTPKFVLGLGANARIRLNKFLGFSADLALTDRGYQLTSKYNNNLNDPFIPKESKFYFTDICIDLPLKLSIRLFENETSTLDINGGVLLVNPFLMYSKREWIDSNGKKHSSSDMMIDLISMRSGFVANISYSHLLKKNLKLVFTPHIEIVRMANVFFFKRDAIAIGLNTGLKF
jgi:hypothetical protein